MRTDTRYSFRIVMISCLLTAWSIALSDAAGNDRPGPSSDRPAPSERALAAYSADIGGSEVIPLWPTPAPGAVGQTPADIPTLTVFLPPAERANGAAVVICPGGGYGFLAVDHEGRQVAEWLNSLGVAGFVLRYRLGPRYHHPAPLQDASRAVRIVRAQAERWNVDPERIGILGFSAGGHLASTLGTHWTEGDPTRDDPIERVSDRPDFLILGYPVITLTDPYAHAGSRRNLLGEEPDPELVTLLSNEKQVKADTPPTFLFHTSDDRGVPAENSVLFYLALRAANVPAEMHLYQSGPHGVGLALDIPALASWSTLCADWLEHRGLLKKRTATER